MNNILKTSTVLLTLSLALSTGAAYAAPTTTSAKNDAAQTTVSANQKTFAIEINGSALKETGFQTTNGKEPMVPLRSVTEALGFELTWNGQTKSVDLINGAVFTTVKAGEDRYSINKMNTTLGTAPQLVDSILYVPASFVSEIIHHNMTVKGDSIVITAANQEEHMTKTGVITAVNNEGKYQSVQIQGVGTDGIVLNVGEDTTIEMADGTKLALKDLHIGMTVKAEHSMIMTMSLPPQTPTYKITVLDEQKQNDLLGTAGTIEEVQKDDEGNISITVKGSGLNEQSQQEVVLRISKDTALINTDGKAVNSSELVKGAKVIGFYSPMLTKSLPPIGTAAKVVVDSAQQ
ncbi:copper amine oxidase N-terminal domain-containing protein [Paenibacillus sp. FSL H8-0261]|uniref:Copper amine oxidase n=1 Tax=Paenibacillus odorifer TaxID=189426 RepID=A0ABX3HWB9_9BACL|nr:copper amine oxidase N-terminal domain-containing protein [Paenibacillus odorifer]OMD55844.1 copper amine oxidase [Paenibacillus odorifer]